MMSVWVLALACVWVAGPEGVLAAGGTADLTEADWVSISICRAHCFNHYADLPVTDGDCVEHQHCYMCWQMCEKVHIPGWARLCEPSRRNLCPDGCQTACEFTQPLTPLAPDHTLWSFAGAPSVQVVSDDQLVIDWHPALRRPAVDTAIFPIYTLFWKFDKQPDWKPACFTGERWAAIDGPHRDYTGLTFKLLAVLPSGVVAIRPAELSYGGIAREETPIDYDYSYDFPDQPEEHIPGPHQLLHEDGAPRPAHTATATTATTPTTTTQPFTTTPSLPSLVHADLALAVSVQNVDGALLATLTWESVASGGLLYTVTWGRVSCRVQEVLPECELEEDSYMSLLEDDGTQELALELPGLTYNSKYWVELTADGVAYQRLTFYTPWCNRPDVTFTRCHPEPRFEAVTLPTLSKEDLAAVKSAGQLPMYISLGSSLLVAAIMLAVAVFIFRRHSELRLLLVAKAELLRSRTNSLRHSLHSSASSLRRSIRGSASSFRRGFRDSIRDRLGQRRKAQIENIIYKGSSSILKGVEEPGSPMLPQRLLAKKSVSFSDQSDQGTHEYQEIDDQSTSPSLLTCPPCSPASTATSCSMPDLLDETMPIYSTPHRKTRRHQRPKSQLVVRISSPL